ncbi:MAG: glycosyltransferase family 2 protein [Patescibacteria group bacterium]|jgi:GT2 family glycosyltransferase
MPKISLHIVAWNSMSDLPDLFESIEKQTYKDFVVRVVDNGSSDGVEKWLREKYPTVTIVRNVRNLGFGAAHNQAIKYAIKHWEGEDLSHCYCVTINPDIVFRPNCLEELIKEAEAHPEAASFTPKLLRSFQDNGTDEVLREHTNSDVIDTTGLRGNKYRWFYERGGGELDQGQFDAAREVFGVCAGFGFYRASALEDVKMSESEYFDEDFFAYKEDIDLAWRFQSLGWEARFVPEAVAHHARGMYGKERASFFERIRNRRRKSKMRSFYSTRNHWWLLIKNMSFVDWLLAGIWIKPAEALRFVYVCFFEPTNIRAIWQFFAGLPIMWRKRREILLRRKVPRRSISQWFR